MFHHIQKTALDKLATKEFLRYSELKPADLDGNVFGYHLKRLISDKFVVQNADGYYSLTTKGRDFIIHRFEDSSRSAHTIFLIVIKNGNTYLVRERRVQPLLGYTGFIHGEPAPELSVIESAQKRLYEKTSLELDLSIKGSALITQYKNDELQSYSHAIILYSETDSKKITESDETGLNYWSDLAVPDLLPSCHDIIKMIENGNTWLERIYYL